MPNNHNKWIQSVLCYTFLAWYGCHLSTIEYFYHTLWNKLFMYVVCFHKKSIYKNIIKSREIATSKC